MSSRTDQPPGRQQLGDFEVVREIGRGGMGVVYEARQVSLNRRVALKVLSAGLGLTAHAVQRFHREAEAAGKLHHTNIVPVYATGEQDGTHFYAMELIEGPSLDRVLRQLRHGPAPQPAADQQPPGDTGGTVDHTPSGVGLTGPFVAGPASSGGSAAGGTTQLSSDSHYFDTAARMIAEVADALEHAHKHGVIHRDIKPSNLLLAPDGRLSVNDFGLARMLEQPGMTMTGEFVGTPAYMSPEQITAGRTPLDHRTDIYSLGATLYELLTLQAPFPGERRDQVLAQILHKEPVPPRRLNRKVPADLETICLKAMEKDPDRRYQSAGAMAEDLRRYLNRFAISAKRAGPVARLAKFLRRHKLAAAAALVILLLATAASVAVWLYQQAQERADEAARVAAREGQKNWAHDQIPVIEAHIQAQRHPQALDLLGKVEAILPGDPRLEDLRAQCSWVLTILTDPAGATVSRKPAGGAEQGWELLGTTPIKQQRVARGIYHWKLEMPGFATVEGLAPDRFAIDWGGERAGGTLRVKLHAEKLQPPDMVSVPGRNDLQMPFGLRGLAKPMPAFFLDRYEVTNRQFKQFVDQGGYQKKEFWEQPFVKDGKALSWQEAMALLRDTTGRPGPATWILGTYPDGQDDYPVSGVSWYEAAAYARFAGKSLPTIHEWVAASGMALAAQIVPRSNVGTSGPAKVGQYRGLGPFGAYDMAGNVKEWCWNSAGDGKRYLLGGAWDEKDYMFTNADARAALDREKNVGFRCVKHLPGQGPPKETLGEAKPAWSDFLAIKPLSDREFLLVKGMYAYARRPLKDKVQRLEETSAWVHERVEVDAAYGNERLIVHLFLPRESAAPYQSVVYWPGTGALQARVIASPTHEGLAFLIKSGRALVWPIYKGTYERPLKPADKGLSSWDVWLQRAKDLSRAIDYLETRKDIDAGAIGYYGLSWGASGALRAVAVEERIKAAVLIDGGVFPVGPKNPEVNPVHYLPRITIPVLMLNGEYDHIFPRKQSQEPLFQLLGTDLARKKHVVFKSGHVATPMAERIQETVSWFDRYLGPVHRKASAHGSPTR